MKYLYILFFIILVEPYYYSQTFGTCPLDSGNVWVYDDQGSYTFVSILDSNIIFEDSLCYSILHITHMNFQYDVYVRLRDDSYYVQRMPDSYNAPNHERIYYKKGAQIGDTWVQPDVGGVTDTLRTDVIDTQQVFVYDKWVTFRLLHTHYIVLEYWQAFTDEFGLMYLADDLWLTYNLYCCIIDGKAYGDTTVLDVDDKLASSPYEFLLEQNYPNPFNPSTMITYQIPESGFVILKVYDILGREIAELVNEERYQGRYSVKFDASELASGVYIYQLRVNDYVSSKKMLLLK